MVLAGLVGAISWNVITWYFGLPSSSIHALIGGLGGAAIAKGGFGVIIAGGWYKTVAFIFVAPLIGLVWGYLLRVITAWVVHTPAGRPGEQVVRVLQLSPRRPTASGTAATTPRRPWASCQWSCTWRASYRKSGLPARKPLGGSDGAQPPSPWAP